MVVRLNFDDVFDADSYFHILLSVLGIVVENPFPNQLKRTIDFGQGEHLL